MGIFTKKAELKALDNLIIKQIQKNTDLIIKMYEDNYIDDTSISYEINKALNDVETSVVDSIVDHLTIHSLNSIHRMISTVSKELPIELYDKYNEMAMICSLCERVEIPMLEMSI